MPLILREKYTFDQLSLGEIMLRLDPGEGRIRTARDSRLERVMGSVDAVIAAIG